MRARVQLHRPSRPPTACCQFFRSHDSAPAARFHSITTMTSFLVVAYEPQDICRDQRYTISLRWHVCWPLHTPMPTPTRRPPSYECMPHPFTFQSGSPCRHYDPEPRADCTMFIQQVNTSLAFAASGFPQDICATYRESDHDV